MVRTFLLAGLYKYGHCLVRETHTGDRAKCPLYETHSADNPLALDPVNTRMEVRMSYSLTEHVRENGFVS